MHDAVCGKKNCSKNHVNTSAHLQNPNSVVLDLELLFEGSIREGQATIYVFPNNEKDVTKL